MDVRLIPDALAGRGADPREAASWTRTALLVFGSVAFCSLSILLGARPDRIGLPLSMYFAGVAMLAMAATAGYLKLHPSVQIGYRERIKELIMGCGVMLGGGAVALAAQVAGMPTIGLVAGAVVALAGLPAIVTAGGSVFRAHRAAQEDEDSGAEGEAPASVTERITERREAWQLSPPPSVVPTRDDTFDASASDELDTAQLPPRAPRRSEHGRG